MVRWSSSTLHCFAAALVGLLLVLKGTALGFFWQVPAPESLPSSLPAGRLFVVAPQGYQGWQVDGRPLTRLPNGQMLGATPLKGEEVVLSAWKLNPAAPHKLQSFSQPVPLTLEPHQTSHRALRIPTATWQRLQSDPSLELRKQQRQKFRQLLLTSPSEGSLPCMVQPMRSRITSKFGSARILPNGHMYHHTGLDLAARVGLPVHTAAPGRVALAEDFVVSGGLVVVHHGQSFTTAYAHLSQKGVSGGQDVVTGQELGRSGATGRVTGPHLHWEVYWRDRPVDPQDAVKILADLCDPK